MTEEEGIELHRLRNEFYEDYGRLVAKYVKQVPERLKSELLYDIQDTSNVFSSCYQKFL